MKKNINRIVAICLVAVMCLLLVPVEADALSYSGSSSYMSGKYYRNLTAVNLTGNQRTDIVNVAKSQVGYQEGSSSSQLSGSTYGGSNYTEYGRWYGMQDMWCAMFVSWCAKVANIPSSIVTYHSYTPTGLSWFKSKGQAYSRATVASGGYKPQPGDIIYFKSARNSNPTNHIGIVTSYSGSTVYTIEGNTSSATISTNGGAVAAKSYSISNTYIVYICKPAYTGTNISTSSGNYLTNENNWIPDSVQNIVFNASYYAAKYEDLKNAFGTDANKLYDHFLDYGAKEGRQASAIFDVRTYLAKNADLKAAYGDDYKGAIQHLASFGVNENRYFAPIADIGTGFKARINLTNATLNLSLSGTNVISYTPSSAPAQIWTFDRQDDGSYKITNSKTGQVLDLAGASKASGTNIQIYDSNDTKAQRWFIYKSLVDGQYILRPACAAATVLSVAGNSKSASANIQADSYSQAAGQVFTITEVSEVEAVTPTDLGTEFYAKIGTSNAKDKNLSLSDNNVVLYTASNAAAQTWRFVKHEDGSYSIINQKTGTLLSVKDNSSTLLSNVQVEKDSAASGQRWFIYEKDGYYRLRPLCATNCVLDIDGAKTSDGANVQIYTDNGTGAQLFSITKGDYFNMVAPEDVGTGFIGKITNVNSGLNLSLSGTNVIIYTPSDAAAQKYVFDRQSDGSYKLTNTKNNYVLDVAGASKENFANVQLYASNDTAAQRWFIYMKEGNYMFRPSCADSSVLDVYAAGTAPMTNVDIYQMNNTPAQKFTITNCGTGATSGSGSSSSGSGSSSSSGSGNQYATAYQMEVLRKIMYAVETGGQVYGNARYDDFTEAYTNTPEEHAITIGAGQWFATEAKRLLNTIREQYPSTFAALDTAGIASDLDTKNWSTYKLSKTSAKAKCIQKIISSPEGIKCQDQLLDEQMVKYLGEARDLGVTEIKAMMMCANLRHLGGLGAVKRVLGKTATPYTLDHIYSALQSDTGNQVGTFRSRNKKVYGWLIQYIG